MKDERHYLYIVITLFLTLYIVPLSMRPMFVPDETRYGEISREMIATGDWIVPHLDGLRYFEKPALGYWLHAASIMVFGENKFAIRFPSAMASGLSALLIFLLVRAVNGKEENLTALAAAMVYLTCFEVIGAGTFCVLDSLLSCFLTGTMVSFFLACESTHGSRRKRNYLLSAGFFCGLAFLTKGFLAFAVPVVVIVPYFIRQRRWRDLVRMTWLPLMTAVLVALPWSILIHLREPDFWHFFFWNEHIRRFLSNGAQHKESFWFFFLTAPAMFMPWIFVAPAAIFGLKKERGQEEESARNLIQFCLFWFIFSFLFFSASRGKLLTYILPCFPPFAVLTATGLRRVLRNGTSRSFQSGTIVALLFFGLLMITLLYLQVIGHGAIVPFRHTWKWLVAVNGLASGILFLAAAFHSRATIRKIFLFGLAPVVFLFSVHFIIPDSVLEKKAPGLLLQRHLRDVDSETIIISGEEIVRAACWYYKRNDVFLLESDGELGYGLQYDDSRTRRLDTDEAGIIISRNPGRVVLVARMKTYDKLRHALPQSVYEDCSGPKGYVFVRY